ncbi:MAG: formylglycine-generating enzyme family protein [Symploca sp. SIO2E9]|nr:formylglycine-generating enzyme family protein [Symploca sp. SIO2E9]
MATTIKIARQQKQVRGFVEDINGISLDMILIPSGTFLMGAPETEEESLERERPQHEVTVSSFFMGRYPITQAQWRAIAWNTDLKVRRDLDPNPSYFKDRQYRDYRPIERISWYDAIEFCARLSRHTQKNYRLPSEAEWEYACRAGTTTPFHFGETISTELANYNGANKKYGVYSRGEKGEYRKKTTYVDYFKVANAFGLSDMHGNVWEWCLDPWHENYKGAPLDNRVWDERNENDNHYQNISKNIDIFLRDNRIRVLRGGSCVSYPRFCRSAYRFDFNPGDDLNPFSFRVVCALARTF